jgi:RNA polymerase sigma-70 factor (sigma-E family)
MTTSDPAFREFVQARWGSLVRYGYLLTGDAATAEDLVQTALERTWRRWSHVRADSPDGYVRQAMAREAVSGHRRRSRRPRELPLEVAGEGPAGSSDPAEGRDARDLMWAELGRLPDRMRAVVVLRLWEDLSVEQVAAVLGCSKGSV